MTLCFHCGNGRVETHTRGPLRAVDQVSGIYAGERRLRLPKTPLAILRHLIVYGQATHAELSGVSSAGSLKVHITRIRAVLPEGVTIENEWGVGYRLAFVPLEAAH